MTEDEFRKSICDNRKMLELSLHRHGSNGLTLSVDCKDDMDKIIEDMMATNRQITFEWLVDLFEHEQKSTDIRTRYGILMLVMPHVCENCECIEHADRLVELGLESGDSGLEETACGLAENTRSERALSLLEKYHETLDGRPWMKSYVGKIISELKNELKL